MRVLVTGGAGYVGSSLVPLLLEKEHEVVVVDKLLFNQAPLLPYFINKRFRFVYGDVRDEQLMKEAIDKADIIIHLAAILGEPVCRANPDLAREVNAEASVLINKLRGEKPLIFASTGSNYGKVDGICTEETPTNSTSLYTETKLAAEKVFLSSGNVVVYRYATGFGVSPRLRLDLLVNDFCYQAVKNGSLVVYQRGARRTFIHVRDMARSLAFAVDNFNDLKNEIFNVGHESLNFTKEEMLNKIKNAYPKVYVHFAEIGQDPDQRDYEVSYAKIRTKGFETKYSLEDGIRELLAALPSVRIHNLYSNIGT